MKAAVIAFVCAGVGFADLVCIDAWLLPAVVTSQPLARASAGMAAAGLFAIPSAAEAAAEAEAIAEPVQPALVAAAEPTRVGEPAPRAEPDAKPVAAAEPEAEPILVAEAEPTPIAAPVAATAPEPRSIYFVQTGAAEVDDSGRAELDALAQRLREDRTLEVSVHGHADARGSRRDNHRLSKRRAQVVARLLQREGVAPRRMELAWFGERAPAVSGASDSAWAANRRVELRVHRSE